MGRKFRDMETPEARYQREQAAGVVRQAERAAYEHDQEAQRQQMTIDVYGRPNTDYTNPEKVRQARRERDRQEKNRDCALAAAREAAAAAEPPSKRRRWSW